MDNVSTSTEREEDTPSTMLSSDDENRDNAYEYLTDECMIERLNVTDSVSSMQLDLGVLIEDPPEPHHAIPLDIISRILAGSVPIMLRNGPPPANFTTPANTNDHMQYAMIGEPHLPLISPENQGWNTRNDDGTPRLIITAPQWTNAESMLVSNLANERLLETMNNEVSHQTSEETMDDEDGEESSDSS